MTQVKYEPYHEYHDSKVAWLRDMPRHWELLRAKTIFKRVQRPTRPEDGVVTAFRDGEVTLRSNRRVDGFTNAVKEIGYQGVRAGDLLIHAMDGFAGAIGVSDSHGKCSPVCSVCLPQHPEQLDVTYYGYLIRQLAVTDYITSLAKGIRERSTEFRFSEFAILPLAVPPKAEQAQIAKFLDYETAKIDALIEKQQQLIALLKEKRQAVISHAVTKGLNPDAPMRDSGVEWLGEVPAHWVTVPLKHCLEKMIDNRGRSPRYFDDGVPILEARHIDSSRIHPTTSFDKFIQPSDVESFVRDGIEEGDVLFITVGTVGNVTMVGSSPNYAILQNLVGLRFKRSHDPLFLLYYLRSNEIKSAMAANNKNSILDSIKISDFIQSNIALPLRDEQIAISKYIETIDVSYGELTKKALSGIDLLQERRTALISAAVTGKIDVRDWKAPESAVEEEVA